MSDSVFFNKKTTVQTEVPILNIAFSGSLNGGLTSGLTLIAGPSRSYKSLLSLVCAKAYLDKYEDAVAVLYDSEGGMTPDYLSAQGIDPARVLHVPIEHLEMLKFDIVKQLKEIERGDKVIFIIDSIGNTGSLKEIQDALDEKSVAEMQRAKIIKGLFRIVTPSLVAKDIPCITICHTYSTMELYSKQIISGGSGLIYSANQAFIIGKSQEKDGTDLAGWNFTLNVEKSRYVKEKSKFTFKVLYGSGLQKYSGLLDLALASGHVIKPNNGWYSRVNMDTGEIEEKRYRIKDTETEEFWTKILEQETFNTWIKNRYSLGILDPNNIPSGKDDDEEFLVD
jgi:RecA/RadA recombinase